MKARLLFFVFISTVILIVSCERKSPGGTGSDQTAVTLPDSFYKRFESKIGDRKIVMNMTCVDTVLSGNFYFADSPRPVPFSYKSHIDSRGRFTIEAGKGFDNSYSPGTEGIFRGSFISENEIKGTWTENNSHNKTGFDLSEKYPAGSAELEVISYHKKVPQGEDGKKGFAEITIAHPAITAAGDIPGKEKINEYLSTALLKNNPSSPDAPPYRNYDTMLMDFFNRYNREGKESERLKMERDIYFNNIYEINMLYNSDGLLSTRETVSTFEGGAHPNTNFSFKNFDLKTGKEIILKDLFKGNYLQRLNNIAEMKFRKFFKVPAGENLKKAGFFFPGGVFNLNNNFAINGFGITFQFNPYEVAAYAFGAPEISIPYSEIKDIIKPNGLLGKFIK